MELLKIKKIQQYLLLSFGLSWGISAIYYLLGGRLSTPSSIIMLILYMFMPMVAVIILQKFVYRKPFKKSLHINFRPNRYFILAWILPFLLSIGTLGISLLFPGVEFTLGMEGMMERYETLISAEDLALMKTQIENAPIHPFWLAIIQGLVAAITVNAVAAFGEELGWRGFLFNELEKVGFWKISLFTGVVWGLWHAPIILQGYNYPEYPIMGVFMMIVFTLLYAPIFTFIRIKSKSVIAASILHGSINATAGLSLLLVKGGNSLLLGSLGISGLIMLFLVNILLYALLKKNKIDLRKSP